MKKFDLRSFILEEVANLQTEALSGKLQDISKVKADEYKPGEEAKQLEKDIDHLKALKIHETRLRNKIKQIEAAKDKLRSRIKNLL